MENVKTRVKEQKMSFLRQYMEESDFLHTYGD